MRARLLCVFLAVFLGWLSVTPAQAQVTGTSKVLLSCGTGSYGVGSNQYPTMDTTGAACGNGTGGGGSSAPYAATPLGFQQITSLSSSTALTIPTGATFATVTVEAQGIRYRDDGTAPTGTVGMPLAAGQSQTFSGAAELAALRFILQTSGAILDVSYYK